jgi:hypothetical protein
MSSVLRVNQLNNRVGLGTITITDQGQTLSGVTTADSLSVSVGSTAAPSISPSGDSNTGIFFPSPDTIAFAEGGAEGFRLDSSGKLLSPAGSAFVGTASSTGNGAIMESGSNANGYFVKYADGTMICILTQTTVNPTASFSDLYGTTSGTMVRLIYTWTYPSAFASTSFLPVISFIVQTRAAGVGEVTALGFTSVGLIPYTTVTGNITIFATAIGRWF